MTTPTDLAGRLRSFHPPLTKGEASRVGLRARHVKVLMSFACKINDHLSCLIGACLCSCHEEQS